MNSEKKLPTVLIVDDSLFMRNVLREILSKNNYEIVGEASNGIEAISKYQELKPDLTTLDITMPEMNGIEALQKIIEIDCDAKIIMCSAMGQQGVVMNAIQLGALDFIIKPFQAPRVLEAMNKAIMSSVM